MLASVANWLYVEPVSTNLMFERYNLENAAGPKDTEKIKSLYKVCDNRAEIVHSAFLQASSRAA